jgi:hypothetical protein
MDMLCLGLGIPITILNVLAGNIIISIVMFSICILTLVRIKGNNYPKSKLELALEEYK